MHRSEIRESKVRELLEKVRKRNYGFYLRSLFLSRVRQLSGSTITFDFPVTALVGPNGSGKSTVLGCAAAVYPSGDFRQFFFSSIVGDEHTSNWELEFELIDRKLSQQDAVRGKAVITRDAVQLDAHSSRPVHYFGVHRTVPPVNSPQFMRRHLAGKGKALRNQAEVDISFVRDEASKVLGKDLASFKLFDVSFTKVRRRRLQGTTRKPAAKQLRRLLQKPLTTERLTEVLVEVNEILATRDLELAQPPIYVEQRVGSAQQLFVVDGQERYSEFNFGSGEASILRLVYQIERLPEQSLILIEEIENGLHPLAVERLIDYLIAVAARRKVQVIFTTHSEYALRSLPSEAVWATLNGRAIQGKLSIESLRALSGRIDKRLAIFTEDSFSSKWLEAILREGLGDRFEEVGVYQLGGDGEAARIHLAHNQNPSIGFKSLCFLDGDSRQPSDETHGIHRLPGQNPELCVFEVVLGTLAKNGAILTAACQRPMSSQQQVTDAVRNVATTNRDPHLLFAQVGTQIGLVSEDVVRGAFLSVWIQESSDEVKRIAGIVKGAM